MAPWPDWGHMPIFNQPLSLGKCNMLTCLGPQPKTHGLRTVEGGSPKAVGHEMTSLTGDQTASIHLLRSTTSQVLQGYLLQATQKRKQRARAFLIPKAVQEQLWFLPPLGEKPKEFLR